VSSDVLVKICTALNCTMDEIVEIVPVKGNWSPRGENNGY
jgi:DNA-binding Xre family transcriptional regulator